MRFSKTDTSHSAYPDVGGARNTGIWLFNDIGGILIKIELGYNPGEPQVYEVSNVIVGS